MAKKETMEESANEFNSLVNDITASRKRHEKEYEEFEKKHGKHMCNLIERVAISNKHGDVTCETFLQTAKIFLAGHYEGTRFEKWRQDKKKNEEK